MSVSLSSEASPNLSQAQEQYVINPEREAYLRRLLDGPYGPHQYGNYESAQDLNLIDEFYYNPAIQEDGIVHILTGVNGPNESGALRPGGFHHEPSGAYVEAGIRHSTVDRAHIASKNSKERRQFAEFPFEPYAARVAIAGLTKVSIINHPDTGEVVVNETNNSMFPKEYDALGVLRMVVHAKNNRDMKLDKVLDDGSILATGEVPMLDGETMMPIKLWLDNTEGKIITAYPIHKTGSRMKLQQGDIEHYLYGEGVSKSIKREIK